MAELQKKQQEKAMVRHFVISLTNIRNWSYWTPIWLLPQKQAFLRKLIRSVSSTAVLQKQT